MLSEKSRPVIEATLPIIAERINDITPDFYRRMFAARPDLMDGMFSPLLPARRHPAPHWPAPSPCLPPYIVEHPDSYPDEVPLPRCTQARLPGPEGRRVPHRLQVPLRGYRH